MTIDEERIVSSTGALSLSKVPHKLVVVGGGIIGLELGSVWRRLGAEVTVVEFLDRITPGMDGEVAKQFQRILKRQGMAFRLGHKVTGVEALKTKAKVNYKLRKDDSEHQVDADVVLVATGRRPYTEGLGLDKLKDALRSEAEALPPRRESDPFRLPLDRVFSMPGELREESLLHPRREGVVAGGPGGAEQLRRQLVVVDQLPRAMGW